MKFPYKVAFLTDSATSANASTTSLPSIPLVTPHAPHANVSSHASASIPIVYTAIDVCRSPTTPAHSHDESSSSILHEAHPNAVTSPTPTAPSGLQPTLPYYQISTVVAVSSV